jgi:hypothetical protein
MGQLVSTIQRQVLFGMTTNVVSMYKMVMIESKLEAVSLSSS